MKTLITALEEKGLHYIVNQIVFFSLFHYRGYDCDAALYLLQVVNYLQPERFVNDVPFMFGNQDSFSFFSPFMALFLKSLGVNNGGIVAIYILLFALAMVIFLFTSKWAELFKAKEWGIFISLFMFILLAGKEYGPDGFYLPMFESFLVARLPSEILAIAGLVFIFDKNKFISLVFFFLATLMHPLIGGWTLPLWIFFHFPKMRIPILVLSLLSPLSGYFHLGRLDFFQNDWNPVFYKPQWDDFTLYSGLLLFWFSMYHYFKDSPIGRFAISLFWVSLIGFYLQFVSSYTGHMLFFQAQPLRVEWLCSIPIIPIFAFFVHDSISKHNNPLPYEYAILALGLCAIAQQHCFLLQVACAVLVFAPIRQFKFFKINRFGTTTVFIFSLVCLLVSSTLTNYVQLGIEQGIGNAEFTVAWMQIPDKLLIAERIMLLTLVLICFYQKKFGFALVFAISFCIDNLRILPIISLLLILIPNLKPWIKNALLASAISFAFFEVLGSLYRYNSSEIPPLEGSMVACVILFVALLVSTYWIIALKGNLNHSHGIFPLIILMISLGAWDIYRWDSRNEAFIANEKQMGSFLEKTIFPQVRDRGKILFTVDGETPTQSRFNFLTGAYADESINIGEVFFKEQFKESNRRRSALLTGTSKEVNLSKFSEQIMKIYHNPDTLLSRVRYLCGAGEITHFATDYGDMPLPRQDSVFLDVKQKFVWLYGCPSGK